MFFAAYAARSMKRIQDLANGRSAMDTLLIVICNACVVYCWPIDEHEKEIPWYEV